MKKRSKIPRNLGELQAIREGRHVRAVTFKDRKKEESRHACRGGVIPGGDDDTLYDEPWEFYIGTETD